METISKPVRATAKVFKDFKVLAVQEGRTMGKMLEILIQTYLKLQEEKEEASRRSI